MNADGDAHPVGVAEMDEHTEYRAEDQRELDVERFRRSVAGFHTLKKSAAASNPDSPIAEKVRQTHRRNKEDGEGERVIRATTIGVRPSLFGFAHESKVWLQVSGR
jgi:hypothetical protein